jgi:hypothetical protein
MGGGFIAETCALGVIWWGVGRGQEVGPLGDRLKEEWEWAAVVEQVAEFGWKSLDLRWEGGTR